MQGEIVYLYAFDVANEIATAKITSILGSKPARFELRTDHTVPKDVPLYKPLEVEPTLELATMDGRAVRPLVRVYSVGVITIAMRVPFETQSVAELLPFHQPVLAGGDSLDKAARRLCAEVYQALQPALVEGSAPTEPEAYTVFCLTSLGDARDVNAWLAQNRRAVAELLTEAQPGELSEAQIGEVLRMQRSYSNTDLVVIDWDAAMVVDLRGYTQDELYVLELANVQLEEYRVMDQRLDRYLDKAYEDLQRQRFGMFGTYSRTLSKLRLFRVDVTRLNDEVTHISKFFGDWYLARIYLGAAERFYLNQWRQSVEDRLSQLDQLYTVVNAEINNRRTVWLEVLVVLFFALEIAINVLKW